MRKRTTLVSVLAVAVAVTVFAAGWGGSDANAAAGKTAARKAPAIPQVTVPFAHEPYFDHTQSSIALKKGWFKQVGITLAPNNKGIVASGDNAISVFASGRVDVISGSAQLFMPAVAKLPPYKLFAIADIFQGYGLMAKPQYKTYDELRKQGVPSAKAFHEAIGQMKGKNFCFPSEAAIKGFITLALKTGGISLSDVKTTVADDSQTTALMQSGRCDFQVGGVPSRLTLQLAGFKPIVTSGDLAATAKPSASSAQLQAVFHDGWLATDKWLAANRDTALRLISVSLRINQFINSNPTAAAAIHTPFLNSVAGTNFSPKLAAKVVYPSLDPFQTFAQQQKMCFDNNDALNPKYVIGSAVKLYTSQGIFKPGQYSASNFSNACQLLAVLVKDKQRTEALLAKVAASPKKAKAASLVAAAKKYAAAFDYLDSSRFAAAAATAVK